MVVGNRLWVAEKDAHRIRCLDARDGQDLWRFTAWLEGDGAYEGMGAVLHFEMPVSADNVDPITVNGLVFPGGMPPFPAIPEAPVE